MPELSKTEQQPKPKISSEKKDIQVSESKGSKYFYGLGRRKRAIAQVRLYPDMKGKEGNVIINQKIITQYFGTKTRQSIAIKPLSFTNQSDRFFVSAKVKGGGETGQAGAVSLGIARALVKYDINLKKQLKDTKLLTRDSREKERKKYGLKRARKAHQYTKR